MKRKYLVLLAAAAAACVFLVFWARRSHPPSVEFSRAVRERLESTVTSNGKVQPLESQAVYAVQGGLLRHVFVERGQRVRRGQALAVMDSAAAAAELASAEARVTEAREELKLLEQGGRPSELADLDAALLKAQVLRDRARQEYESLLRLLEKKAATRDEAEEARTRMAGAEADLSALQKKRETMASAGMRALWQARLREAEAALRKARQMAEDATLRSPVEGVVYHLAAREGDFLPLGALVAEIGDIRRLKVTVFVDEPELGRLVTGMPVTITWDALPDRKWSGKVDRIPTHVVALGNRQVGEVVTLVENPQADLLPGANINASILSQVVENALTIPKEALRQENGQSGVWILSGNTIAWRPVKTGIGSLTRIQILEGLQPGDAVALPGERVLHGGLPVNPIFP